MQHRHRIAPLLLALLLGGACSTEPGVAPEQPRDPLAAHPAFARVADLFGLLPEMRAQLGPRIFTDPRGDFFHPDPSTEPIGTPHVDIVAVLAFTIADGGRLSCDDPRVWCGGEEPGGDVTVFCAELAGPVPLQAKASLTTLGVALREPAEAAFEGTPDFDDYWEGASRAAGVEIFDEPQAFSASFDERFGYFQPDGAPVRALTTSDGTTMCTVLTAPDEATQFRMFAFGGKENEGAADVAPDQGFEEQGPVFEPLTG